MRNIDNLGGYITTCPELSNKTIPKKSHAKHRIVYNWKEEAKI